jgi:ectoine hydroxylase-related dioxygenase (phytanoyl-CoA dioxygenase family)
VSSLREHGGDQLLEGLRRAAALVRSPSGGSGSKPLSTEEVASFFREGYLIKRNALGPSEVDIVNEAVERCWRDKSIYNNATISAFTGTARYTEAYMRNVDASARLEAYKLNHLYLYDPATLSVIMSSAIRKMAAQLLDGTPLLFNSLNMETGTQQRFHFDTFYMAPRTKDKLVVAWTALEDIRPGSGALRYYPKSHLIPPYVFSHGGIHAVDSEMSGFDDYIDRELGEHGLEPTQFYPNLGDVFFWHGQLYHGGSPIEDRSSTRRSMVTHFWRMEDMPPEMCLSVGRGSYILAPEFMFVAPSFTTDPVKDSALQSS